MRFNYWVGLAYTMHMPRELIEHSEDINRPTLPLIQIEPTGKHVWLYNLMKENNSIESGFQWIYRTTDRKEFNLGSQDLASEIDLSYEILLPISPPGTRFWFFKPKTVDIFLNEYREAIQEITQGDWISGVRTKNPKLANESDQRIVELSFNRLTKKAESFGAIEAWKPFTLNDYFNDGDYKETPLMYKLYTKE